MSIRIDGGRSRDAALAPARATDEGHTLVRDTSQPVAHAPGSDRSPHPTRSGLALGLWEETDKVLLLGRQGALDDLEVVEGDAGADGDAL